MSNIDGIVLDVKPRNSDAGCRQTLVVYLENLSHHLTRVLVSESYFQDIARLKHDDRVHMTVGPRIGDEEEDTRALLGPIEKVSPLHRLLCHHTW
ncbi:MAG: hypothetical protein IT209_07680 [Armatimonadetes bacterium]|nr:hypothetical protein [Armatimonadota bacterium]